MTECPVNRAQPDAGVTPDAMDAAIKGAVDAAVQQALLAWGREPTQLLQVLGNAQEPLG